MTQPTLLGQLSRVQAIVVVATCALLVLIAFAGSAVVLRRHQDRFIESIAIEIANGAQAEAAEGMTIVEGTEEYFHETHLPGYHFELLAKDGTVLARDGDLPGWTPESYELPVDAKVETPRLRPGATGSGRFRACARPCNGDYIVRVVTDDALARPELRWLGGVLLGALPVAALFGVFVGRAVFRRRLAPLALLEAAAEASSADPGVTLEVQANAREIATLRDSFNGLLRRLSEAFLRERRFSQEAPHELRTPLAVLRGRLEQLQNEEPSASSRNEHLATALREVDVLDRLIEALLLLARSEFAPLPTFPVNLCDIARDIAVRQAEKDGVVSLPPVVEAPDEILVLGSEELLSCAVSNLVENARKFAGTGGRIRISVTDDGAKAMIAVADDGPGIAAGDRERIFERFYRASEWRASHGGVGLGLAVAKTIASRHLGTIEAGASDLGGAELRITIPRLQSSSWSDMPVSRIGT